MKKYGFALAIFVLTVLTVLFVFPVAVYAAPLAQDAQPPVGFDVQYIMELIQALILATVPVLAGMAARWMSEKIKSEKLKFTTEQSWTLDLFIKTAVYAAEQMRAKQYIDNKLEYTTGLAQKWLTERGITVSVEEIRARIEATVKQELNNGSSSLPANQ